MATRPINKEEQQFLALNEAYSQQRLKADFNWLLWLVLMGVVIAVTWFDFMGRIWYYLLMAVLFLKMTGMIYSFLERRKEAKSWMESIADLKKLGYFEVQIITSKKALHFIDVDHGDIYLVQSGKNELYCWVDADGRQMSLLPNTKMEVYLEAEVGKFVGRPFRLLGKRYQPLVVNYLISREMSRQIRKLRKKHATRFEGTIEGILSELTEEFKPAAS